MPQCRLCNKELGKGGIVREDKSIICPECDRKLHGSLALNASGPAQKVVSGHQVAGEREQVAWLLFAFTLALALLFGILWYRSSAKVVTKTVEVPKEVAKTVVVEKEVPKEVIKEVEVLKEVYVERSHPPSYHLKKAVDASKLMPQKMKLEGIGEIRVHVSVSRAHLKNVSGG